MVAAFAGDPVPRTYAAVTSRSHHAGGVGAHLDLGIDQARRANDLLGDMLAGRLPFVGTRGRADEDDAIEAELRQFRDQRLIERESSTFAEVENLRDVVALAEVLLEQAEEHHLSLQPAHPLRRDRRQLVEQSGPVLEKHQ